jgi:hypothetical protein
MKKGDLLNNKIYQQQIPTNMEKRLQEYHLAL